MLLRSRPVLFLILFAAICGTSVLGQDTPADKPQTVADKAEQQAEKKKSKDDAGKDGSKAVTAEQVAEASIFVYGMGGGRLVLDQIRKTTLERGKTTVTSADGKKQAGSYARWMQRGEKADDLKIRLDRQFPDATYSMVSSGDKIVLIFNKTVFTPSEEASRTFQNETSHGLDALLRYKENGSTLTLEGKDKIQGVEYYLLDVTDKTGTKTRFYVSVKSYRVMMLDYEDAGVKYRRKFYDYNVAQGTLVPFRTVLWADGKVVEETEIGTVTFGQKIEDSVFAAG